MNATKAEKNLVPHKNKLKKTTCIKLKLRSYVYSIYFCMVNCHRCDSLRDRDRLLRLEARRDEPDEVDEQDDKLELDVDLLLCRCRRRRFLLDDL